MAVKRYKPTSPARRLMTVPTYGELTGDKPERALLEDQRKSGGRNHAGKITVRHIGGGNRRKYRIIDFKRNKDGVPATGRKKNACRFLLIGRHQRKHGYVSLEKERMPEAPPYTLLT